jgi:hypothetical protein
MYCTCAACRNHARTLGLERWPTSRKAVHRAYRSAAKLWHPDRFANDEAKIQEAEERFKSLQIAYRELAEHNPEETEASEEIDDSPGPDETPKSGPEAEPYPEPVKIPFASVPGCYSASALPPQAEAVAGRHLSLFDYPVAMVDLSGDGSFDRFFLLASHGVIVRDASGNISLLLYPDLGRMELENRQNAGKVGLWEKIAGELTGIKPKLTLQIFRRNGAEFCSLTVQATDAAKVAIYQYLSRKKRQHKA